MKVTMVGISGSGKTTFMSALYGTLGGDNHMNNFRIFPAASNINEDVLEAGKFKALDFATQNFKFPDGTQRSTLWSFDLRYRDKFVCNYEWIDYRGGILTDISSEEIQSDEQKQQEVTELLTHIALSNAVIFFVDSFKLTYYQNIKEARYRSGANIINQVFESYNRFFPSRPLVFVILLTKADEVNESWKTNNYEPLIKRGMEIFEPLISIGKRNNAWEGGIVPVSAVGEGNARITVTDPPNIQTPVLVDSKIVGFPEPMNAGHALFYCLGEVLSKMQVEAQSNIDKYEQEIVNALQRAGLTNRLWSLITGQPSYDQVAKDFFEERKKEYLSLRQFEIYVDPIYTTALEKVKKVC